MMAGTGWKFYLPHPYGLFILPRSGLGAKHGIVLGNLVGLIDTDYQGETKVCIWNRTNEPVTIARGQPICQAVPLPFPRATFKEVTQAPEATARGDSGIGSTGMQAVVTLTN